MDSRSASPIVERIFIGGTLEIPRVINGLWQLAGGHDKDIDIESASKAMDELISVGLDAFDMADHYGDAELIIGHHRANSDKKAIAFTKWCPTSKTEDLLQQTEAAVDLALKRMNHSTIPLLQYHCWSYSSGTLLPHIQYLHALRIAGKTSLIGLTNTDSAHLELLLNTGFYIATNQVSVSVLDRRVTRGRMSDVCIKHGVGILAYGTLLGGFLSENWLGVPEPEAGESLNWSLRKYLRFIKAAGGWDVFQGVLRALKIVADRHGVGIPAVAMRFVLDIPGVSAVIIGTRLSSDSGKYAQRNLETFSFKLTDEDRKDIEEAQGKLRDLPGDCGDEYRRPPFLTAKGDLSDHLGESEETLALLKAVEEGKRIEFSSGSKWEPIAVSNPSLTSPIAFRMMTFGLSTNRGTTANVPTCLSFVRVIGGSSSYSQTIAILDIIEYALHKLGSNLKDVVRTRIIVRHERDCEEVSRAHGWVFGCVGVRPANTLLVGGIVGEEFLVEVEAEAVVGCGAGGVWKVGEGA
ncbi:NADP-dependent oxidoreductase domain-containing protein [Rhexocercosporidium sp. MPI-PUGE-AT-0058]|nr:NADP-dependent oxidoreductase domain-containing protein [Rhexocercosporidium sp. MPI-PUGE-AT-0058]